MYKEYHISQTTKLLMNGNVVVENTVSQRWAVSYTPESHILIEVLEFPKQEEDASIFQLLSIINMPACKVMFDFDNDDNLVVCNKAEIKREWEKCKKEVRDTFGTDDSIENFLTLTGDGYAYFDNEMKSSLLYYTLWTWFGGGKSFNIIPPSSFFMGRKVDVEVTRISKELLSNDAFELVQRGEGNVKDRNVEDEYNREVFPLTNSDAFNYQYHIETTYHCRDRKLTFFDSAQTVVHEQASEGYSYITNIAFISEEGEV